MLSTSKTCNSKTSEAPQLAYVILFQNSEATDYYMGVIAEALKRSGWICQIIDSAQRSTFLPPNKESLIVTASCLDAFRFLRRGYKNVAVWCQGIVPEESFLRNRSKYRAFVLSMIEKIVLKKAKFVFLISAEMKHHFEMKYHLHLDGRCAIMPCFNTALSSEFVLTPGKYDSKIFVYMGSLAAWQCFEKTAQLFKAIEERIDGALFKVYCFDKEGANRILKDVGVRNYWVGSVPPDQVASALSEASFGFVVREDRALNRVATPTKLSSYLSAGVIPIFSDCLIDFKQATMGMKHVFAISSEPDIDALVEYCNQPIDAQEVLIEFAGLFKTYYSKEKYVKELSAALSERLGFLGRFDNE